MAHGNFDSRLALFHYVKIRKPSQDEFHTVNFLSDISDENEHTPESK